MITISLKKSYLLVQHQSMFHLYLTNVLLVTSGIFYIFMLRNLYRLNSFPGLFVYSVQCTVQFVVGFPLHTVALPGADIRSFNNSGPLKQILEGTNGVPG